MWSVSIMTTTNVWNGKRLDAEADLETSLNKWVSG